MKKLCCDGYMSCYEKQRWATYNERRKLKPLSIKNPINKVAPRRAKQNALYAKEKAIHLKEFPYCQFPGCRREKNLSVHHTKGRIEELIYKREFFITLCVPEHHDYVEMNPEWAKENELSVSRLDKVISL